MLSGHFKQHRDCNQGNHAEDVNQRAYRERDSRDAIQEDCQTVSRHSSGSESQYYVLL